MPRVFKKTIVQHWLRNAWIDPDGHPCAEDAPGARFVRKRRVPAGTPGAVKVTKKSTNYYGRVPGRPDPVPLCGNEAAAKTMLADLIGKTALHGCGLGDPFEGTRKRPLAEHLADFIRCLEGKDNAPRYVELVRGRLEALFDGCGFRTLADLDAGKAADWLAAQRSLDVDRPADPVEPDLPALPPRGERPELPAGWSRDRLAELLGVKPFSVPPAVARHGLQAHGNGRNRRYPRETVEALLAMRKPGASVGTTNQYAMHLKVFGNWLVRPGRRLAANPFLDLEAGNESADRRHDRRELTAEELRHLLEVTRASGRVFRGLDGEARFVLYATACATGFRAGGLAGLTPECFDLDGRTPTVTLPVRSDKSRRGKLQPLPGDVAELLRGWLAGKPAGQPVWPGKWASQRSAALMLRRDLNAAGIPFVIRGPDGPLYADFHALRHTYLTLGGRAGIDLRTLQELAGHSTADLTERYTHVRLLDLAGAVEKLPSFLPTHDDAGGRQPASLRATGTDAAAPPAIRLADPDAPVCRRFAGANDGKGGEARVCDGEGPEKALPSTIPNPLPSKGIGGNRGQPRASEGERAMGFEPTTSSLGSATSPAPMTPVELTCSHLTSIHLAIQGRARLDVSCYFTARERGKVVKVVERPQSRWAAVAGRCRSLGRHLWGRPHFDRD
jgi:integrase